MRPHSEKDFEDEGLEFGIMCPDGWEAIEPNLYDEYDEAPFVIFREKKPPDDFTATISIGVVVSQDFETTLQEGKDAMEHSMPNYHLVHEEWCEVNGRRACLFILTFTMPNPPGLDLKKLQISPNGKGAKLQWREETEMKNLQMSIEGDGLIWVITCGSLKERFKKYEGTFRECVFSFKLQR